MTLVLALRGATAILVLTTLAGGLPRLVRLGLAALVGLWAAWIAGGHLPAVVAGAGDVAWWMIGAHEIVVGATLGLVAAMPLIAAGMAGRLVDVASEAKGSYAGLFAVLAAAVFVGIDGHVTVVAAIVDSFRAAPAIADVRPTVLDALGGLVPAAVSLALPWLVTAAVVEIAVGAASRIGGRAAVFAPAGAAVPAALVMMTATLIGTLAVAIAALVRGAL